MCLWALALGGWQTLSMASCMAALVMCLGPWCFRRVGPLARHPSQLYEFALEGVVLFIIALVVIYRYKALEKRGLVAGLFVAGYGVSRFIVEFAREPDAHIGYIGVWGTLGMIYSLPLIGAGLWLIMRDKTRI